MKNNSQKPQKNSPPFKGGVSAGRGGSQYKNLETLEEKTEETTEETTTPSLRDTPPSKGGEPEVNESNDQNSGSEIKQDKINNLPHLKTFRKDLRNNLTPAEAKFWKIVQNKNFEGRKFRRQHSVGNYILDFYCPSEKLAVELDGSVHFNDTAREYDYERRLFFRILRHKNSSL